MRRIGGWRRPASGAIVGLMVSALLLVAHSAVAQGQTSVPWAPETFSTSAATVDDAVSELESRLAAQGLEPLGQVPHSEILAAAVGADLRDTKLILFQDASNDGALLAKSRTYGIDLPQKVLVWEDAQGDIKLSFNNGDYLARRHRLGRLNLTDVDNDLRLLASSATPTTTAGKLAFTGPGLSSTLLLIAGAFVGAGLALVVASQRRVFAPLLAVGALAAATLVPGSIDRAQADTTNGLITVASTYTLDQAVENIRMSAEQKGLRAGITVTHAADDLPPTVLLTFGQPELNAELLEQDQLYGVDLPQKFLIWEGEDGIINITYNDPVYLGLRHGVESPTVRRLQTLMAAVAADGLGS